MTQEGFPPFRAMLQKDFPRRAPTSEGCIGGIFHMIGQSVCMSVSWCEVFKKHAYMLLSGKPRNQRPNLASKSQRLFNTPVHLFPTVEGNSGGQPRPNSLYSNSGKYIGPPFTAGEARFCLGTSNHPLKPFLLLGG